MSASVSVSVSAVGVGVGVAVGTGVGPGTGTGGAARPCGEGVACTNQSAASSFVSLPFPSAPPGKRSRLDPAGGAAAGAPSTNPFVASPHPIASIGAPPTTRSATAPPVAANPPVYVRSATAPWTPAALAMRIRRPGSSEVAAVHVALRVTVEPLDVA